LPVKRLFWLGLGMTVGVLVTRWLASAARRFTPSGVAENLATALHELASAIGGFGADVRAGMAERERELHELVDERIGSNGKRAAGGVSVPRQHGAANSAR
jgi:hypothetical protein